MLSLHNWGGTGFRGTADGTILADRYNVVAIGVDYLGSGPLEEQGGYPYDFGWLQALDALRALYAVFSGLRRRGIRFADDRLYATGGSGGGNVALMANKLAPQTFAAVIDLCGMKKLSDEIAFEPGGNLQAGYSRDPASPFHLTRDEQEIRFLGHPGHLDTMRALGCQARIISVHGVDDDVCPFADAREFAWNMKQSGLDFSFIEVTNDLVDGAVFQSTGHDLGNRSEIVDQVGRELLVNEPSGARRSGPSNFERGTDVQFRTEGGKWVVDFQQGLPIGRFESEE
ncbi:hypothetical protein BH09VER1_BH09VER1_51720 [soil metagenome]